MKRGTEDLSDLENNKKHNSEDLEGRDEVAELRQELEKLRVEVRNSTMSMSKKIGEMFVTQAGLVKSTNFHGNYFETITRKFEDLDTKNKNRDKKLRLAEVKQRKIDYKLRRVESDVQEIIVDQKDRNILVNGLYETKGENVKQVATNFLKQLYANLTDANVETAYRLGEAEGSGKQKRARPMMIKLKDLAIKKEIMRKKATLKDQKNTNMCIVTMISRRD